MDQRETLEFLAAHKPAPSSNLLGIKPSTLHRFLRKIQVRANGCWDWTGCVRGKKYKYGAVQIRGLFNSAIQAHRVSYMLAVGPIPEGHHLHHECGNTICVNPSHLLPATPRDHVVILTPDSMSAIHFRKSACVNGHTYTAETTAYSQSGFRRCLLCERKLAADQRHKLREKNPTKPRERKTHCLRGHALTPENSYFQVNKHNGAISCKICRYAALKASAERKLKELGVK